MNYELRSAAYLILQRDNQVLMLLRQNTGYMDGKYDLPENCVLFTRRVLQTYWPQHIGYSEYGWE